MWAFIACFHWWDGAASAPVVVRPARPTIVVRQGVKPSITIR